MNPEDLDLPQPPEGVLHPTMPWSRINPNSRLWLILKSKLTGRRQGDESYTSYVNLSDADADRLIENIKKDPRGYPSLDQESGTPIEWMERQRIYQEWLVEEYLEKPFRKKVDQKIEDAEIDRLVNTRRENKVKPQTPLVPKQEEVKPEVLPPVPPEPKVELIPEIPKPVAPEPPPEVTKPKPPSLRDEDLIPPYQMPSNVSKAMAKYGAALDKVSREISKQNFKIERNLGYLRRIDEDLDDIKFSLEQQSETYQEALDDFETEERKKESRKKFIAKLTSPFRKKEEPKQQPKKLSQGGFLNSGYPVAFSGGGAYPDTPIPGLAAGGIVNNNQYDNTIPPGIYDNPTRGKLAPGTAVIPLNRNYGKQILNQYDQQQYNQSLAEVLTKPVSALLGAAVSVYGSILRSLGPLAGYFNNSIPGILSTVSSILGISRSSVINMFGGPAYAGTEENRKDLKYFYKSWRIYMDNNKLYFPGAGGPFGGAPLKKGEIAKDIMVIGAGGEGLRFMGGTNVNQPPAWIPFSKADTGKIGYVSGFGMREGRPHTGIDLDGDTGIKIISPFAGKVFDLNRRWPLDGGGGYGNYVGLAHERPKIFTFYGHMQDVADHLSVGTEVKAGEVLGTLGNTGRSTGPHLHWEVRTSQTGGQIDPVQWTQDNKPSFADGGWLRSLTNLISKPRGLSIRGVQAGFTGMAREGFQAIMGGDKFRLGSWKPQILGRGAYSAPTLRGAQRYAGSQGSLGGRQTPGGVVRSIVPGGARRITIIEPQAAVKPSTFDKGKLLADKLLKGEYANSPLANKLRSQLIRGSVSVGGDFIKFGKYAGKLLGIAGVVLDVAFPEPVGSFDQVSGPNAYYNAPGYKATPSTKTIQIPSSSSPTTTSVGSSKTQFVNLDIPTSSVMTATQLRRMS